MTLTLKAESVLSEKDLESIHCLTKLCRDHDGLTFEFDQEDDFKKETDINTFLLYKDQDLISYINLFVPGKEEAELMGFTHPDFRKRGFFNRLLKVTVKEIQRREIPDILFVCDIHSHDGKNVFKKLGAQYEFSEYAMKYHSEDQIKMVLPEGLEITRSMESETGDLVLISRISVKETEDHARHYMKEILESKKREFYTIRFNQRIVGMIGVYKDVKSNYIHGFCIDPDYRKKRLGLASLIHIVNLYHQKEPDQLIELEVQVDNAGALSLYEKAGFRIQTAYDYSRYPVKNLI